MSSFEVRLSGGDPIPVQLPGQFAVDAAAASAAAALAAQGVTEGARNETLSARDVVLAAASDVDGIEFPRFGTVAALLAGTLITTGVTGRLWFGGGLFYREAASSATDHHVATAGGIKLYVIPTFGPAKPVYEAAAFGITPALSGATLSNAINAALAKMPTFTVLRLGAGEYVLGLAGTGTVLPSSAGTYGAIYLDKQGQELIGAGFATHLNGNNLGLHVVMCRASYQRVRDLRIGNVRGELVTAEAAGVCAEPSNYPRISPGGADIVDIQIHNCDFYQCENGVTAHPEAWGTLAEATSNATTTSRFTAFYKARQIKVTNCRFTEIHRTGVELFQADDSEVTNCLVIIGPPSGGLPGGFESVRRAVRGIGSARVKVTGNTFIFTEAASTDVYGVECSLSGFYSLSPQSTISQDFQISGNHFANFASPVFINASLGNVSVTNNTAYMGNITARFVDVRTAGVATFDTRFKFKVGLLKVQGNTVVGGTHLVRSDGAIDKLEILDNDYIGGDVDNAHLLELLMASNANPAIAALERVPITVLRGNTCVTKANTTAAPVLLTQLKADDRVYFDDNRLVASAAGGIIGNGAGTNSGTVVVSSLGSNERISATEWAARYNPMASTLAERRLL